MSRLPTNVAEQLTREHREELQTLLEDPALATPTNQPSEEQLEKALRAARALGYCKLFGAKLKDLPDHLPVHVAEWAAAAYARQLSSFGLSAIRLPQEWENEDDPAWRDQLCLKRLEERLDAQAEYVAITESLEFALENDQLDPDRHDELVLRLSDALRSYDGVLESVADFLCTVHENPALAIWREALVPEYSLRTPWWLGPGLQETAERISREVDALVAQLTRTPTQGLPAGALAEATTWAAAPPVTMCELPTQLFYRPPVQAKAARTPLLLKWHSPNGAYVAISRVEFPLEDEEALRVTFFEEQSGSRAEMLRGRAARFAGVEAVIDDQAQCCFRVADLRKGAETNPVRLEVADEEGNFQAWPVDDETLAEVSEAIERYS